MKKTSKSAAGKLATCFRRSTMTERLLVSFARQTVVPAASAFISASDPKQTFDILSQLRRDDTLTSLEIYGS